jgi:hypothetical protein
LTYKITPADNDFIFLPVTYTDDPPALSISPFPIKLASPPTRVLKTTDGQVISAEARTKPKAASLGPETTLSNGSKKIKDLCQWFFVASPDEIAIQRAHLREEFLEERVEDEEQEHAREPNNEKQRKREQRARDKEKDIQMGKRDSNGKLIHIKVCGITITSGSQPD